MAEQTPSIGRVVHFVTTHGTHVPAIVCEINGDGTLDLFVMRPHNDEATFERHVVQTSDGSQPNSWHWPEFVPAKE